MSKSKSQLTEELEQSLADFRALGDELESIKGSAGKEIAAQKEAIQAESDKAEEERIADFEEALSGYLSIRNKAITAKGSLMSTNRKLLGVPALAAIDAQLQLLEDVFGDLPLVQE